MRLCIAEFWNEDTNTSDITVTPQLLSPYSGDWIVQGEILINGDTIARSGDRLRSSLKNQWADCAVWRKNGIPHKADGSGEIMLTVKKPAAGYSHFTAAGSTGSVYLSLETAENFRIPLHGNEPGAQIIIGGEIYGCLIGNGTSYDYYSVKIGSGTEFK